jgi:hypothetical protein
MPFNPGRTSRKGKNGVAAAAVHERQIVQMRAENRFNDVLQRREQRYSYCRGALRRTKEEGAFGLRGGFCRSELTASNG